MIPLHCPKNITRVADNPDETEKGYTTMISYQKVGVHILHFPLPGTDKMCMFAMTVKGEESEVFAL